MNIQPTSLFTSNIGCCTVPSLTMEQYESLQQRQTTEVSQESADYLIKNNYGIEPEKEGV